MAISYTVPAVPLTVNLPQPAVGGVVTWTDNAALGSVTPSNDGQSALFNPGPITYNLTQAIRNTAQTLTLTAVAASAGGTAVYTGTITGGAANAFAGFVFVVTVFVGGNNNGTFICTASTATTLTLSNGAATAETHAGTATSLATRTSYVGTLPGGAANGLLAAFTVTGFTNAGNNAVVTAVASTATVFGGTNASGVNETHAGFGVTPVATSITITATIAGGLGGWRSGTLYRLGDSIVDPNGHTQTVTTASKLIPSRFTSNLGIIPQGGIAKYRNQSFTLSAAANTSANNTVYTGTGFPAAVNALAGLTFQVAGFVANTVNDGTFICVASTSTTITLTNPKGVSETITAIATSMGDAGDPQGYGTILNTGGDSTGDWPSTALAATSGNTNQFNVKQTNVSFTLTAVANSVGATAIYTGTITGGAANAFVGLIFTVTGFVAAVDNGVFACTASTATTLTLANAAATAATHAGVAASISANVYGAPVGWTSVGYSAGSHGYIDGGQAGVQDVLTTGSDSRIQVADWSDIGPGGLLKYYDGAGNLHTGAQVAGGTQTYASTLTLLPTFSTSGGTVADGDLVWTDQGAASTAATYAAALTVSAVAAPPLGYYVVAG